MIGSAELRLSALRAFLGHIHPEIRLVKVKSVENVIRLCVVLSCEPTDEIREDVSIAAAEIVSDFPEVENVEEIIEVTTAPLTVENLLEEGWIYRRAE